MDSNQHTTAEADIAKNDAAAKQHQQSPKATVNGNLPTPSKRNDEAKSSRKLRLPLNSSECDKDILSDDIEPSNNLKTPKTYSLVSGKLEIVDDNEIKPLINSIVKSPTLVNLKSPTIKSNEVRNSTKSKKLSWQTADSTKRTAAASNSIQHQSSEGNGVNTQSTSIDSSDDQNTHECPSTSINELNSSSESDDDEEDELSEQKALDGGYGWVIVFASFIINMIADGISFSFGVFNVEFLKYFGDSKGKTAWIGSIFMAVPLLSGPIASYLTDRYGCRKVTIVGSILASIGFLLSSISDSMEMLFLTFGVIAGLGLSLCYVAAVVIVAYYFDKKRSFATGISVCGSGIGTFIFPPVIQYLITEYGWRGCTVILAGIFLNICVCGTLMKDLEWTSFRAKQKRRQKLKNKRKTSMDSFSITTSTNNGIAADGSEKGCIDINIVETIAEEDPHLFSSLINLPTFADKGEKIPIGVLEQLSKNRNFHDVLLHNYPHLLGARSMSASDQIINAPSSALMSPTTVENSLHHKNRKQRHTIQIGESETNVADKWLRSNHHHKSHVMDILKDLKIHRHSLTYRGAMLNINRYRLRASSCPDIYRNSMTTIVSEDERSCAQLVTEFKRLFKEILDFSYFLDIEFLLFAISNFILYTWYDVVYVYLPDWAIEHKVSESDASLLISLIGIVNMFGEIVLGWAGDRKELDPNYMYAACMAFCGVSICLIPLFTTYQMMCILSSAFGLFIAANYSLTSIILVNLVDLDRFTNAYGLLLLVQGIANLLGPPIAGWGYDLTGTYDLSFYLSGGFIISSGVLLVILPIVIHYRKYKKRKNSRMNVEVEESLNGVRNGSLRELRAGKETGVYV